MLDTVNKWTYRHTVKKWSTASLNHYAVLLTHNKVAVNQHFCVFGKKGWGGSRHFRDGVVICFRTQSQTELCSY